MRNPKLKIAVLMFILSAFIAIGYAVSKEGMTKAQMIDQIQKSWDDIWVNGNMDEASGLLATSYTDDAVIHRIQEPDMDPSTLKEFSVWLRSQFSDTRVIVDDVIAEGDRMVIQYTMNAKIKGPSNVLQYTFQNQITGESQVASFPVPIGTELSFKGCGVLRLVDGKIAEEWGYSDSVALLQQAGIAFKSEWLEQ